MNTALESDGNLRTTINQSDRKAFVRVMHMAQLIQANMPSHKDAGAQTEAGVKALLAAFPEEK